VEWPILSHRRTFSSLGYTLTRHCERQLGLRGNSPRFLQLGLGAFDLTLLSVNSLAGFLSSPFRHLGALLSRLDVFLGSIKTSTCEASFV